MEMLANETECENVLENNCSDSAIGDIQEGDDCELQLQ